MVEPPLLAFPDFSQPFVLHTDASIQGLGAGDADSLSRIPVTTETMMKECAKELSLQVIQATIQSVEEQENSTWSMALLTQSLGESNRALISIPLEEILLAQRDDQNIAPVITYLQASRIPLGQQVKTLNYPTRHLMREWERLILRSRGVLKRQTGARLQLVLPERYKRMVLTALHDEMGHQGVERTTSLVRERFF